MKNKKVKIFKLIILILIVAILCYLTAKMLPLFKNISTNEGRLEFKNEIDNLGLKGVLMLAGLMMSQVFLAILPGEPIELLAGMCFGTIGGTILIFTSVFIITTLIFFLVRKYGKKFIYEFCSKEKISKIEKSKLFNNPKKVELIMFILFLIPGTPKDFLIYIGGILPVKPLRFILISTFARFPSVISSTIAGENLISGNIQISILAYIVTFALAAIFIFCINIFDKNKVAKNVMDTIK